MKNIIKAAIGLAALTVAGLASADITFYERDNFYGRQFTVHDPIDDFRRVGFNDRASSIVVTDTPWEVCDGPGFRGHCLVLRPGNYPNLGAMGLNDRVSSVRMLPPGVRVDDSRWAPPPQPAYDWRPRPQEQLFSANVIASHAVYGSPQQHCWVEQEAVGNRQNGQVGGAVIGGILGGILGHQVARGNGATIIGAVGGAAIGSAVGGNAAANQVETVQHCAPSQVSGPPLYWDTVYTFRGQEHHVQTTAPAGPTLMVNGYGEPRVQQ